MKTIKILIFVMFLGIVASCKNNKDGYSDEIETSLTPIDTTAPASDSTNTVGDPNTTTNSQNSGMQNSGQDAAKSTAGQGTGPSASSQDGATYTSESGVQKDSARPKTDSIKRKKK